jgi:hypothetical protein
MADNVAVTAGTGTSVAADEVVDATLGTVKVQYVKIMDGTLDGTGKVPASATSGLGVNVLTKAAGEDLVNDVQKVEQRFNYSNIITNATTTVKSGAGFLHSITINNPAALTVANETVTIYDNTAGSGTKIGTYVVPFGLTSALPFTLAHDVTFSTGLTIVTAGSTVAPDITVSYR